MRTYPVVVLAMSALLSLQGRTEKPEAKVSTQHAIVPLTSKLMGGVVSGDPAKPGAPFVIRIQNSENQVVPPHWHPEDEHITVVKGTWYLGHGDKFDRDALQKMEVGDYAFVPKQMRHFGWSKTETIIQVHGVGPFQVIVHDPWDLLSGTKMTPQGLVADPAVTSSFRFQPNDRVRSKRGDGVIISGARSEKNHVTQYEVEKGDGTRFFEFEEELVPAAPARSSVSGPLTGTWACVSQGLPQEYMNSTLYIAHENERVTGVLTWPGGGGAFTATTSTTNALEIHINSPQGQFVHKAEYRRGELIGEWSIEGGPKGRWECKKKVR